MSKHFYEISLTSRFVLSDEDIAEIEQSIGDLIDPVYDWETINVNLVDSEGYDENEQ